MLRNNSDMPKTLKNKMVSGNPRPYPIYIYTHTHTHNRISGTHIEKCINSLNG